jgi:NADPH-dependent 2,4-dienoyl-CoA reductase/sulfur reductase-like enzyme
MEPDRPKRDAVAAPNVVVVGAGPTGLMLAGELALNR